MCRPDQYPPYDPPAPKTPKERTNLHGLHCYVGSVLVCGWPEKHAAPPRRKGMSK